VSDRPYRSEVFVAEDGENSIRVVSVTQDEYEALVAKVAKLEGALAEARDCLLMATIAPDTEGEATVAPRYCPWCGSEIEKWWHDDNCKRPFYIAAPDTEGEP
jgi:hypothetical protein